MEIKYHEENGQRNGPLPLEGITVVEYGVFHAGPGGGAIMGDLGADVIKIEAPEGDAIRFWTKVAGTDIKGPGGESLTFEVSNRNKRNICLNIKTEEGREVLHRLVRKADVFMSNLRKETRTRSGVDYDAIRKINSKIIYASVSGYGSEGPMQNIGAFDPLGQACSGMMFNTGGELPAPLHIGILDQATAITLSHSILAALLARERQGIAQEVHVSLYGSALWLQHINLMLANVLGINPCVSSDRFQHSPLRNVFCCKDGEWVMCTHHPEEKYWATFCKVMGTPELLENPEFTDPDGRPLNPAVLTPRFDQIFATRTRDEWMVDFLSNRLMFAPIQRIMDVKNDPQALENGFVRPGDYPGIGEIAVPGYPVYFSECQPGIHNSAAARGAHTDEIMIDLGYDTETIALMRKEGVVE